MDLLEFQNDNFRFHAKIDNLLQKDGNVKAWKKARTLSRDLKYYKRYRLGEYDVFHTAARAVAQGNSTSWQQKIFRGLTAEIENSKVFLPIGQMVCHGRADEELATLKPYPSFVSTSLNPMVALNHTNKRAVGGSVGSFMC